MKSFLAGYVSLYHGDSRDVLQGFKANSFDSSVTDPPYALTSIVKRFGTDSAAPARANGATGVYGRSSAGFMGQKWDTGDTAFDPGFWAEVLRVLKPGAHLLAFGGSRTYHRLACAIEDAGFEIRDQIMWVYGSGFPKSHNQGNGLGTALKPAHEPIVLARKPLIGTVAHNIAEHGVGALNIDRCRVGNTGARNNGRRVDSDIYGKLGPMQRVDYGKGRWPANVIHDGSDEVISAFPGAPGMQAAVRPNSGNGQKTKGVYGAFAVNSSHEPRGDMGSAARFFYAAKADSDERAGSKHPTVKPVDLMQYCVRLITPRGGLTLDPFAGTGTTGEAAWREGVRSVLIEREDRFCHDIERRMELALSGPDERRRRMTVARGETTQPEGLPLFGGGAA